MYLMYYTTDIISQFLRFVNKYQEKSIKIQQRYTSKLNKKAPPVKNGALEAF